MKPASKKMTSRSRSSNILKKRNTFLVVGLFAFIGTMFIVQSFASTPVPEQCRPASTSKAVTSDPVCIPVGSSGGVTYWLDNTFPNKKVHVVRVDLTNKRLIVRASHISERGKTPTEFAKVSGAIVAINGDFFDKNNNYITNGLAIGNGERWAFTKDKKTSSFIACTIDRDCFTDDYYTERELDPKKYINVVGGSEILLTETFEWHLKPGEPGCGANEDTCSVPHPRTGVGLSADRKVMWMVMVEGRQPNLTGLSLYDFTRVFKKLGARYAINMDGGGSSGMVINKKRINGLPSGETAERKVGNSLGIVELPANVQK